MKVFWGLFLCFLAFFIGPEVQASEKGLKEGWVWPVLVYPPEDGWDSPKGITVKSVLSYAQSQVNDSIDGIMGRDILLKAGEKDEKPLYPYRAVISFGSPSFNKGLVQSWKAGNPPIVLADDDRTLLRNASEDIIPGVFAVQFHRSYPCRAAVERARASLPLKSEVAVFSDMVDFHLSRAARATVSGLISKDMEPHMFWISGGDRDSYSMIVQEMLGYGSDMLVLWMEETATREIYRETRNFNGSVPVWASVGAVPGVAVLDGIYASDQDEALTSDIALRDLKTDLWDATRVRVPDILLASKAYAACRLVIAALKHSDSQASIDLTTKAMAEAKGIPLGGQLIDISPVTHRPKSRFVSVLQAKDGEWTPIDRFPLSESGPGYYFDTKAE